MAPLPVIGNVVRVTLNWSSVAGVTPRNVIHLITASEDGEEIGAALDAAFDESPDAWQTLSSGCFLQGYSILVLDGTSATQEVPHTGDPLQGGGDGQIVPAACAVLSMRTTQRGPRGRGRLYIGPTTENVLAEGIIQSSYRTSALAAWPAIQESLQGSSITADLAIASYVHAQAGAVTTFGMRPAAGTQRRRQNQLLT